jgi:hypothetical protein
VLTSFKSPGLSCPILTPPDRHLLLVLLGWPPFPLLRPKWHSIPFYNALLLIRAHRFPVHYIRSRVLFGTQSVHRSTAWLSEGCVLPCEQLPRAFKAEALGWLVLTVTAQQARHSCPSPAYISHSTQPCPSPLSVSLAGATHLT